MTASVPQLGERAGSSPATAGYTIDGLARLVGMSPRNIRAHQARGLLPPPTRYGRTAYYSAAHVRRLASITSLQRQGFNLVAIEAMLGVRHPAPPPAEPLTAALGRIASEHPALLHSLVRHGVLARAEDGSVTATRPRTLQPALDLHHAGIPVPAALRLLAEMLDRLRPVTDELVPAAVTRLAPLRRTQVPAGHHGGAPAGCRLPLHDHETAAPTQGHETAAPTQGHETAALTQGVVRLLAEAFRAVAEDSCAGRAGGTGTAAAPPDGTLPPADPSPADGPGPSGPVAFADR
ncbi:MerR family transcriptional regulator [Plantactinospora sp. WMMC1484]|uniref:MerR family transcriptional regulator n=1 Tax=Plantactinospora sp. WMMC1484 TaxID=3404122 RepID=UPI003BF5691E